MRLAHKYNWHHAPVVGPFEDGYRKRKCDWCGFSQMILPDLTDNKVLELIGRKKNATT